jgi:hypothetical protein
MNSNIINQHKEIFMIFELLMDKLHKHLIYEETILDYRNKHKPKNHINVDDKIKNHKLYHKNLLKQIEILYNKFENHIITMDIKHLHKL